MENVLLQDLTIFFNTLNTPLGVAVLLVIGYVILPRLKFLKDFWPTNQQSSIEDLKPALLTIVQEMERISGNDLIHIKDDIVRLEGGISSFRQEFVKHDKQAGEILTRVDDCWQKIRELPNK